MLGQIAAFILGLVLIFMALASAVRTFVVPRGVAPDTLTRSTFLFMRALIELPLRYSSHSRREIALAYYAPSTLLLLPVVWLAFVLVGYSFIYWAIGAGSWVDSINTSRLSLLYLGSDVSALPDGTIIAFSETVLSLLLAAILVSFLPAIYGAFSQREEAVTGLETLAGSPATPYNMLKRYHLIQGLDAISEQWPAWQTWFERVEESHTALIPLIFYRSPQPGRSWVTAAGAILDTASLVASTLDRPRDPHAELCIRAGYLCLTRVAMPLGIPFNPDPAPNDPISVKRQEYDDLCDRLAAVGVPLKPDRDQTWQSFQGWRVNYDAALVGLAVITASPPGVWSSDRLPIGRRSPFLSASRLARRAAMDAMTGRL